MKKQEEKKRKILGRNYRWMQRRGYFGRRMKNKTLSPLEVLLAMIVSITVILPISFGKFVLKNRYTVLVVNGLLLLYYYWYPSSQDMIGWVLFGGTCFVCLSTAVFHFLKAFGLAKADVRKMEKKEKEI